MKRSFFRLSGIAIALCAVLALIGCARSPQAKSAAYLAAGKDFIKKNDVQRAILQFRNAAVATPKDAEVLYQLSLAYWAAGDVQMGIGTLHKALDLNPEHTAAKLRMAQIMSMASDPKYVKDAQDRLAKLLTQTPDNPNTLQALAFTELKLGESESAIAHLGRAVALAPTDVTMNVSLAQAKLQQNDIKGAEEILRKLTQQSPKSPEAAVVLGSFLRWQRRAPEAEQEYMRALSLSPENGQALTELANLQTAQGRKADAEQTYKRLSALPDKTYKSTHAIFLFQEGRRDEAVRELESLAKADPEDRAARSRLIVAYRTLNRNADVEKVLDQALKKNPKDADALLQRAEVLIGSGKYDQADIDLNHVLNLRPDSPQVHYALAKLHQSRGEAGIYRKELLETMRLDPTLLGVRLEAAQGVLESNPRAAMSILDEAPNAVKGAPEFLAVRNWAFWGLGDMAEMRKGIDRALMSRRTPEILLQDGLWNLRAGKFAQARVALEEALKIDPTNVQALSALDQSYAAQKQNAVALQKIKEYASSQPKSAEVQQFLGVLLAVNGKRDEARQAFASAKAVNPSYLPAELSTVQLDIADGKWDDAHRQLTNILSANPLNQTARLWLGNVEITQGNHKAALDHFRKVVEASPNNAQALNNYAYVLSEFGNNPTEALKYAQKAKELVPGDATYGDTLGWILYRKGLYPSAVTQLESVAAKDGDPVWTYHLAMAYAKAGNVSRGRAALERAMKLNPNLPEAKIAQEVVSQAKQ